MNMNYKRATGFVIAIGFLMLSAALQTRAQASDQNPTTQTQTQTAQADELLGPLNLTPDQIQKIRGINAELRDERQAANQRLRLAQRQLAEAIQSPTPDETLISQRSKEVADAQANTIRLRSLTEARILQVLTPDQRVKLREIRQRNQAMRRERNQQTPGLFNRRQERLQRNGNANTQLGPRQRKLLRQQQQQQQRKP
jgi:Spy/CpxP family protein refolding chaperone